MQGTLSKASKDARVREMTEITGLSTADANKVLKQHNWRLDAAIDTFYSNLNAYSARSHASTSDLAGIQRRLDQLWAQFAEGDVMDFDATTEYCEALGLDPGDVVMLALSRLLKAPTMGHFAKSDWINGWKSLRCDTLDKQREHIETLRTSLADASEFRKTYAFAFDYAKAEGQKSLQFDIAKELWKMLIPLDPASSFSPGSLEAWLVFLETSGSRAVSRDTWNLFLDFIRTIDERFEQYDEDAAWPSLIDDFVQSIRTSRS